MPDNGNASAEQLRHRQIIADLQKTAVGRMSLSHDRLIACLAQTAALSGQQLVCPPAEFEATRQQANVNSAEAIRECILGITEVLMDLSPRVQRIEAYLEEIAAEEQAPGPRAVRAMNGRH